jgi:hypothetical protein
MANKPPVPPKKVMPPRKKAKPGKPAPKTQSQNIMTSMLNQDQEN